MSIRRALAMTFVAVLVLAILVYGLLFQAYGTNDDVAIRLILEGRFYPDRAPVPWVIFVNLALSQALVALHRTAPALAWYDLFEQGLLWSSLALLIYLICRGLKTWSAPGVVACSLVAALCVLLEIQFTTVAVMASLAGSLAIARPGGDERRNRLETLALIVPGVLVLIGGAALRLEAMAVTMLFLATAAAVVWVARGRAVRLGRIAVPALGFAVAMAVVGGLSVYHARGYAADPQWAAFSATNDLRASIQELAPARASQPDIDAATKAAGWTPVDYALLKHMAPLDMATYSVGRMQAFTAALPPLGRQLSAHATLKALAIYPLRYWYLAAAFLALAVARVTRASALLFTGLNLAFVGLVFVVSLILKPLPHHLFWPLALGHLLILTLVLPKPPIRPPSIVIGLLVGVGLASLAGHAWSLSQRARQGHAEVLAYLDHRSGGANPPVVILGGGFPYERAERPFHPVILQARLAAIPTGLYAWSPLAQSPQAADLASLICGPNPPEVLLEPTWVALLPRFYEEDRARKVTFARRFAGRRISAYQCVETSP